MPDATRDAIDAGERRAREVLARREEARELRAHAMEGHEAPLEMRIQTLTAAGPAGPQTVMRSAGLLLAEGDSWFDYPLHDVLGELEDRYGYDVESVAHKGDSIELMAYGDNQLDELMRRIEKIERMGATPKAMLLSGGGNDLAGNRFAVVVNHFRSGIQGVNADILRGVIERIRDAYLAILTAVTRISEARFGHRLPVLVHGYDYAVPDGRGYLGGWGPLPGPWLEPGFREKGYRDLAQRKRLVAEMIDALNEMLRQLVTLQGFEHVQYVSLLHTLSTEADYELWWANELHPTEAGFQKVAERFAEALDAL